jgi:hypothetical protein
VPRPGIIEQPGSDVGGDVGFGVGLVLEVKDPGLLSEQLPKPEVAVLPLGNHFAAGAASCPQQDAGPGSLHKPAEHDPDLHRLLGLVQGVQDHRPGHAFLGGPLQQRVDIEGRCSWR